MVALGAALVAIVCAVLLPLLPVAVSTPVVSWPASPGAYSDSALQLVTQRPLALSATFDCTAVRTAAATTDGLLLQTMPREAGAADRLALRAAVRDGRLSVSSRGVPLYDGPVPPGACRFDLQGDLSGVRLLLDGRPLATAPGAALPDVDALVTSLPATGPTATPGLAVTVRVDDQAATSPTPLKLVASVLLVLAVVVVLGALGVGDRRRRRAGDTATDTPTDTRPRRRAPRPAVVDLVVPLVILAWAFLAPMTDDDGYYSAMAANVPANGYVANYYQLYNQSFTPFTWIYHALSWWQSIAGFSPVVLRVPAVVLGLLTWFLLRAFAGTWSADLGLAGRWPAGATRAALASCFLGWWLPYDMGVRPEAVVALSVIGSLYLLSLARERSLRTPAAGAVGVAAFGMTAAPTGFVALAPLLAGAAGVWRLLRSEESTRGALVALIPIIAPGALVGFLAFVDGSLRDFTRAQQIFLGMQAQETWYTEIGRWNYLLTQGAMGNYAKRAPVLLGVLAVVLVLVLVARARRGGEPVHPRLAAAGWTTLAGFALLWLTPSKWTHHFGTLAGVGGALVAMVAVAGPVAAWRAGTVGRPAWPAVGGLALLVAALAALAGHGPNSWPYSWLLGLPDPAAPPQVSFLRLDQPLWYLVAVALLTAVLLVLARRRKVERSPVAGLVALSVVACLFLTATTVYLVGGFALGAANTAATWSPWADAVRDPLARDCGAAGALETLDPASASPLPPVLPSPGPAPAFVPGGFFPTSPPPAGLAGRVPVVGSFGAAAPPGVAGGADAATGTLVSPWYPVPELDRGQDVATAVAGRTGGGNSLRVEYARPGPGGVPAPLSSRELGLGEDGDAVDSTAWRSIALRNLEGPPAGATLLRLVATDTSTARGGWLAVAAPSVQTWRTLQSFLPTGAPTAVGWQFAFLFPCQRQPVQVAGINEPTPYAVAWGDQPLSGLGDGIFQLGRGGHFAQSLRDGSFTQLSVRLRDAPEVDSAQLYAFAPPLPVGGYRLDRDRTVEWGSTPAPNTTFSVPVDQDTASARR